MFRKKSKLPVHWSKIEASAPGKFVLIGDFGDLYERNVIAVAIDRRLRVIIRSPKDDGIIRLHLKEYNETWEWPTRLPIFSMTKLVANYADTLVYNEPMLQKLRPLLNEKYLIKAGGGGQAQGIASSQPTLQSHNHDSETINADQKSSTANTSRGPPCQSRPLTRSQVNETKKHQGDCTAARDFNSQSMDRQTSPREQADMAVLSFLLLYISLGDSFAASIRPSLDIEVESDIPIGRGLGSSTAYAVAMCSGLMKVFRVSAEPNVIIDWTQSIDRLFHGEKSSLHSSVAVYGGYIYFQHGKLKFVGVQHQNPVNIMLIDTGYRRDPKLVNIVLIDKLAHKLDTIDTVLNSVNELTSQTWRRMNDQYFLPSTIDDSLVVGQQSLDLVGMGHQKSFEIFHLGRRSHLTAKQSQAGETVFLLYDGVDDFNNVIAFRENLKSSGYRWLDQCISFEGFKVTTTNLESEDPFPKLQ